MLEILELLNKNPVLPAFLDSDSKDSHKRKQEELLQFGNECEELFSALRHRFLEALLGSVRASLDYLRRKLNVRYVRTCDINNKFSYELYMYVHSAITVYLFSA